MESTIMVNSDHDELYHNGVLSTLRVELDQVKILFLYTSQPHYFNKHGSAATATLKSQPDREVKACLCSTNISLWFITLTTEVLVRPTLYTVWKTDCT